MRGGEEESEGERAALAIEGQQGRDGFRPCRRQLGEQEGGAKGLQGLPLEMVFELDERGVDTSGLIVGDLGGLGQEGVEFHVQKVDAEEAEEELAEREEGTC